MFDLITIGDSTMDTFVIINDATKKCNLQKKDCKLCLNYADKIPITDTAQSVGGNANNVAVGAKKTGLHTAIITELGDDISGFAILQALDVARVDTRFVKMLKGKETRYSVILNYKSERTILSYHTPRKYTLPKLPKTKWIYYTSLGQNFEKLQNKLINHLKKNPDIKLASNPGSYQMKNKQNFKKILPYIDLLILNKEEAIKLVGKKKNIKLTLKALLKSGAKIAVITDGAKGSYASDSKNYFSLPASTIKAVAKTGAGDAYTSGFLSAMIRNKSVEAAMQWGTANSSGVIQQFGAQKGLLSERQIKKMIKTKIKRLPKKI